MSLKSNPDTYEIVISSVKDSNQWSSIFVEKDDLLLKVSSILLDNKLRLEAVALVTSGNKNRYDLPT